MSTTEVGAVCFGLMIGWITYRTLRRKAAAVALSDISTVLGAVGGAAVTALFKSEQLFGLYAIGLTSGFFLYLIVSILVPDAWKVSSFMGD